MSRGRDRQEKLLATFNWWNKLNLSTVIQLVFWYWNKGSNANCQSLDCNSSISRFCPGGNLEMFSLAYGICLTTYFTCIYTHILLYHKIKGKYYNFGSAEKARRKKGVQRTNWKMLRMFVDKHKLHFIVTLLKLYFHHGLQEICFIKTKVYISIIHV